MSARFRLMAPLFLVLAAPAVALACLWDYDTLRQEKRRFPSALELMTGNFPRHSQEFYQWRIKDRLAKLKAEPENLAYYDDLGVAYEKTGQHAKAIETMLAKEKLKPGLYETYSNLGTFHILAGDFEEGLSYIDKALAINPDAHFGRERYQKWLVEYAMQQRGDGKLNFPLQPVSEFDGETENFYAYLRLKLERQPTTADVRKAIKGVQGMMLFANYDNPLLLEALGDLLAGDEDPHETEDAKQLAARAYLQAARVMKDEASRVGYRKLAENALAAQTLRGAEDDRKSAKIDEYLATERDAAERWYAGFKAKELSWIAEGKDVDAEFDRAAAKFDSQPVNWLRPMLLGVAIAIVAILLYSLLSRGFSRRGLVQAKPLVK